MFRGSALSPIMMCGSVGASSGLLDGLFLKFTPSISSPPAPELGGARGRRFMRFLYELLLTIFSFSNCMPRIFGGVSKVGGGVGGTLIMS